MPKQDLAYFGPFATETYTKKYSQLIGRGKKRRKEHWKDIARRVPNKVYSAVDAERPLVNGTVALVRDRILMPGGRYLYGAGRDFHQTNNCFLFRAEDSREGWASLMQKITLSLMTGGGIGVHYGRIREEGAPIRRTGGVCTGPLALMEMVNESGRHIMQGGSRRSAIWAGLPWGHPDIMKFVRMKDWSPEVRALKAKDFNFPARMDGTNISVCLDDTFFKAYGDQEHPKHALAHAVFWETIERMLKTGEPGFSVNIGKDSKEILRNAPVASGTYVLLKSGYSKVGDIVDEAVEVWTGQQWATTTFRKTKENTSVVSVRMTGGREIVCDPEHEFLVERWEGAGNRKKLVRIDRVPASELSTADVIHHSMVVSPSYEAPLRPLGDWYALGYVYGDGSFHPRYPRAEVTFCTEESKSCLEGFNPALFTSVTEEDTRGFTRAYLKNDHLFENRLKSQFPEDVYAISPSGRASFIAGLFDSDGNWFVAQSALRLASKHREFLVGVRRLLESLMIRSVIVPGGTSSYGGEQGWLLRVVTEDVERFRKTVPTLRVVPDEGVESYRPHRIKVVSVTPAGTEDVFCCDVGVEEHSFQAEGVIISNCTEITSDTDSDVCNLASVNLARIDSKDQFREALELATAFCVAGTVYSDVPFPEVDIVRSQNRRLGVGLMGIHEWLLVRGKQYGPDDELAEYLEIYREVTDAAAPKYADLWGLSHPVKKRAIAPNGTIGIVAETTTGIEPILAAAYKRRYLDGRVWKYMYVVDPTAKRLVEQHGVKPADLEDAYSLARDVGRRVEFNAFVQDYVDHAISSTVNLPEWGSQWNNKDHIRPFGDTLMKHLPRLRGITAYPDGSRGGQPLTAIKYETAMKHQGTIFEETMDVCEITGAGSCGV